MLSRATRVLALAGALAVLGGHPLPGQESGREEEAAHADLACMFCHRGSSAGRSVGAVPEATCTASGCHEDGGPEEVRVSTVVFPHRAHGDTAGVRLGCAGCHGHAEGDAPVRPTLDACGLCHADQIGGEDPAACRACHSRPVQVPTTNQGVPIPHRDLPWLVEGCTRCHYDVARPPTGVSLAACRDCHADVERVAEEGIGRDLHPAHTGVGCLTCHAPGRHEVQALSSAVELRCAACHGGPHGLDRAPGEEGWLPGPLEPAVCTGCHRETHAGPQRMVLGLVEGMPVTPAYKFVAGLSCGSCHAAPAAGPAPGSPAIRGGEAACEACHRPEYRRVLGWWREGTAVRAERAADYQERAARALGSAAGDSARSLLEAARRLTARAAEAGGHHNLILSDGMLRRSLELVEGAYAAAGRSAPPRPAMGRRPRVGFCSYCHYRPGEPAVTDEVPADFHEELEERFSRLRSGGG